MPLGSEIVILDVFMVGEDSNSPDHDPADCAEPLPQDEHVVAARLVRLRRNARPGIVEFRPTADARIVGPYRPLVDFNAGGPNTDVRREVLSFSGQLESQLRPGLSLRAAAQWVGRDIEQDRFTTGQYVLATGRFSGVREPRHLEQDFNGIMFETNLTWRVSALKAEHKLTLGRSRYAPLRSCGTTRTAARTTYCVNAALHRRVCRNGPVAADAQSDEENTT